MKLLTNPLVCIVLGLLLGAVTGIGMFWRQAEVLVAAARVHRAKAVEPERPDKPWDFWTLEIENLASELKDQRAALAAREQAVAAREERLVSDMRELEKTRKQIEGLRSTLAADWVQFETDEVKNLKTLAKTYGELSPNAAVGIMQKMEDATVVKILHLMKSEAVSLILQQMGASADPELAKRAALLTERLRLVKPIKSAS